MNKFLPFSQYNFWACGATVALIFAVDRLRSTGVTPPYTELLTATLFGVLAVVLLTLTLMSGVMEWSPDPVTRPFREAWIAFFEAMIPVGVAVVIAFFLGAVVASVVVAMWFLAWLAIELLATQDVRRKYRALSE